MSKRACKYGAKCTRKNPVHFKQFSHPTAANLADASAGSTTKVAKRLSKLYSLPFPQDFVDLFNYCQVMLRIYANKYIAPIRRSRMLASRKFV